MSKNVLLKKNVQHDATLEFRLHTYLAGYPDSRWSLYPQTPRSYSIGCYNFLRAQL